MFSIGFQSPDIKYTNLNGIYVETYRIGIIKEIAESHNILPEDLLAMCIKEGAIWEDIKRNGENIRTGCRDEAIGDEGYAFGAFQINTHFHKLTDKQKRGFTFQTEWTAKRLLAKGYRDDHEWFRKNAIKAHNGWNRAAEIYAQNIIAHSKELAKIIK